MSDFASKDLTHGQTNALVKMLGGHGRVLDILSGRVTVVLQPQSKPKLLERVSTQAISAAPRFVANKMFLLRRDDLVSLRVACLGDNFKKRFLDGTGLIERAREGFDVQTSKLTKSSTDTPIIAELGGEKQAAIPLSAFYTFLKDAERTKWYICYAYDQYGVLRAVVAGWDGDGWFVSAYAVDHPSVWGAGGCVLSSNSGLAT